MRPHGWNNEKTREATGHVRAIMRSLRAYLKGDIAACLESIDAGEALASRDPEVLFYMSRHLERIGEGDRALATLNRVVENGFLCSFQLEHDSWLASVRMATGYADLLGKARQRQAEARAAFLASGGERITEVNERLTWSVSRGGRVSEVAPPSSNTLQNGRAAAGTHR
jgi:hypothetical protein